MNVCQQQTYRTDKKMEHNEDLREKRINTNFKSITKGVTGWWQKIPTEWKAWDNSLREGGSHVSRLSLNKAPHISNLKRERFFWAVFVLLLLVLQHGSMVRTEPGGGQRLTHGRETEHRAGRLLGTSFSSSSPLPPGFVPPGPHYWIVLHRRVGALRSVRCLSCQSSLETPSRYT